MRDPRVQQDFRYRARSDRDLPSDDIAILATDLLYGILIGVAAEITLLVYLLTPSLRAVLTGRFTFAQSLRLMWNNLCGLFRSPVIKVRIENGDQQPHYRISLGTIVCFNILPLDKLLQSIPPNAGITLAITESGRIIDHTAMEYLHQFEEECVHAGRSFEIQGLDNFYQFTSHSLSARMQDAKLVREKVRLSMREQQMAEVARHYNLQFEPTPVATLNSHNLVYLRRGADRQEKNVMTGDYRGCEVKLFDYSHTAAPDYYAEYRHTIILLHRPETGGTPWPNLALTQGNYLERYLVEYQEVELTTRPALTGYQLYAQEPALALTWIETYIEHLLLEHPGLYVEIRDNVMLAFRPDQYLELPEMIERLLAFAEQVCSTCKSTKGQ